MQPEKTRRETPILADDGELNSLADIVIPQPQVEALYCTHCGTANRADSHYCRQCG